MTSKSFSCLWHRMAFLRHFGSLHHMCCNCYCKFYILFISSCSIGSPLAWLFLCKQSWLWSMSKSFFTCIATICSTTATSLSSEKSCQPLFQWSCQILRRLYATPPPVCTVPVPHCLQCMLIIPLMITQMVVNWHNLPKVYDYSPITLHPVTFPTQPFGIFVWVLH